MEWPKDMDKVLEDSVETDLFVTKLANWLLDQPESVKLGQSPELVFFVSIVAIRFLARVVHIGGIDPEIVKAQLDVELNYLKTDPTLSKLMSMLADKEKKESN